MIFEDGTAIVVPSFSLPSEGVSFDGSNDRQLLPGYPVS